MYILGIETSCDETAASVVRFEEDEKSACRVLSDIVASQHDVHARFGGVVPELASRRHVQMIEPVVRAALADAGVSLGDIEAFAVTRGPGLVISLLVGLSAAKGMAWARRLPLIGVHHLDGHIHSLFLDEPEGESQDSGAIGGPPPFPHLAFVVSGGHTDFYRVEGHGRVFHLGGTLDDAVGEAYDKVAATMGLGYPGGPLVDRLHGAFRAGESGPAEPLSLPRPYLEDRPYHFSFSGLKTAVLNYLKERDYYRSDPALPPWARAQEVPEEVARSVAAGFQEAVVDVLVLKVARVIEAEDLDALSVSGGVASNRYLRERLSEESARDGWSLHMPPRRYCTDNAAMIACAGGYAFLRGGPEAYRDYLAMDADPAWELAEDGAASG